MLFNSASLFCAIAVGAIAVSATPVKINRKPVDPTEYFVGDVTVKKAEYIYYGHGLDGVSREDDEFVSAKPHVGSTDQDTLLT